MSSAAVRGHRSITRHVSSQNSSGMPLFDTVIDQNVVWPMMTARPAGGRFLRARNGRLTRVTLQIAAIVVVVLMALSVASFFPTAVSGSATSPGGGPKGASL